VERNKGIKELDSLERHNVYSPLYITRVIKSRRMSGLGQVARERERRGARGDFVGKTKRKNPLRKINCKLEDNIKCRFNEYGERAVAGLSWLKLGTSDGF
jgi:hypothetical protein